MSHNADISGILGRPLLFPPQTFRISFPSVKRSMISKFEIPKWGKTKVSGEDENSFEYAPSAMGA